jgi:hypothetical protein
MALLADQARVHGCAAAGVPDGHRCALRVREVAIAPLHQGHHRGQERATLLGQPVLEALPAAVLSVGLPGRESAVD